FSLVPAFCPDANLRVLSDLDYLLDKRSLPEARRVLEDAGYRLRSSSDIEFKFTKPSSKPPTLADDPYSVETELLVELHLAFWKAETTSLPLDELEFQAGQTTSHDWQGLSFPVLKDEDAFDLQIRHVFQHVLECWVKLSWPLEIGYFARARALDNAFWNRVDIRMRKVPNLWEFAGIVLGLSDLLFAPPLPDIARQWMQRLRPSAKTWLANYGEQWAIQEHPFNNRNLFSVAKLCLFLHQEYLPDR